MIQFLDTMYKWVDEGEYFVVSDIDPNFFACRYQGSEWGFVMDKDVFTKQLAKGKIESYTNRNLAV